MTKKAWLVLTVICLITVMATMPILTGCTKKSTPAPSDTDKPVPAQPKPVEPVTLKFYLWDPPTSFTSPAAQKWADELEKRTDGNYKAEIAWGGSLGPAPECYDIIKSGRADMGYFSSTFYPGVFPMSDMVSLPWAIAHEGNYVKIWNEFYKAGYLDEDFTEVKVLFYWGGPGLNLYGGKKSITSLADVQGTKLACTGQTGVDIVNALGGIPVSIDLFAEGYSTLQTGLADGAWNSWLLIDSFKHYEVLHTAMEPTFGDNPMTLAVNKKVWDGLPGDIQNIMEEISDEIMVPEITKGYEDVIAISKESFTGAGGKITNWSSADIAELETRLAPLWSKWMDAAAAKGRDPQTAVDAFTSICKQNGIENPALGYD